MGDRRQGVISALKCMGRGGLQTIPNHQRWTSPAVKGRITATGSKR